MDIQHGIIDVHAHVIPGVDDGSRVMRESVSLLKRAAEQGIVGVIATPHSFRKQFGKYIPISLCTRVRKPSITMN